MSRYSLEERTGGSKRAVIHAREALSICRPGGGGVVEATAPLENKGECGEEERQEGEEEENTDGESSGGGGRCGGALPERRVDARHGRDRERERRCSD